MRRMVTCFVILLLAVPSNTGTILLAQSGSCAACQPARLNNGWNVGTGELTVCFKNSTNHTWDNGERDSFLQGMGYWTALAAEQGRTITLNPVNKESSQECPSGSAEIKMVSNGEMVNSGAVAESLGTSDGHGGWTHINRDVVTSSFGYWQELGAHEFGHYFDFRDISASANCGNYSVMSQGAWVAMSNVNPCGDRTAVTTRYQGGNSDPGNDYADPVGGDCWEWLRVTFWENFDGTQWNYVGFTIDADLGTYCDGPPPF